MNIFMAPFKENESVKQNINASNNILLDKII